MAPQYAGSSYISSINPNVSVDYKTYAATVSSGISGGNFQSLSNWLTFPGDPFWSKDYTQKAGRAMSVRA